MVTTRVKDQSYDLIIIGGGIYGSALCYAATSRGLKVALFEKNDFAGGASANSLKTIHGGIRYLQTFNLLRTIESIKARNKLLILFKHSLKPMRCMMPTYMASMKNPVFVRLGFTFYNFLSWFLNKSIDSEYRSATTLNKSSADNNFLKVQGHAGFACWYDPQAQQPERIVIDLLMSARRHGASVYNYVTATNKVENEEGSIKLTVQDRLQHTSPQEITGLGVVDCTGGAGIFSEQTDSTDTEYIRAVNLVLKLPAKTDAYTTFTSETMGSRLLFFCPWKNTTMVGTWYFTNYSSMSENELSDKEIEQILTEVNSVLTSPVSANDILHVHIGLLPASGDKLKEGGDQSASLIGHTQYYQSKENSRLFRMEGIKFTTALLEAERHLMNIMADIGLSAVGSVEILESQVIGDVRVFIDELCRLYTFTKRSTIQRLVQIYGRNSKVILDLAVANNTLSEPVPGVDDSLMSELKYVIEHESAKTLSDVLLRRIDVGTDGVPKIETIQAVADYMVELKSWKKTELREEFQQLLKHYHSCIGARKIAETELLSDKINKID